ncbi:LTA synthase family protein [Microbulbifer sp. ALW1]|uniref:LTA synthase family protein n=1 Tax=Microbulbifer sp. (strain ALW1) TaxID=1516059 RepID=UPI00135B2BFF|nr:LTA synthase family protein [Microbulbifer sp. ALW1]
MKRLTPFKTVLVFAAITLVILSISRLYLSILYFERIGSFPELLGILFQGVRVDLIIASYLYLIPMLVSIWLSGKLGARLTSALIKPWLCLALVLSVFMELVTPEFILEYDIRPNRLFIDYLGYPREVFGMLWEGYKPAIFLAVFGVLVIVISARKLLSRVSTETGSFSTMQKVCLTFIIFVVGVAAARSSLQHRPFNPAMVYYSNDNLVNSLMLNSTYSVLYAAYNTGSEEQAADLYGRMRPQEIIEAVQESAAIDNQPFLSKDIPTLRFHPASYQGAPKNIVILLQESLGARYVGSLGGEDLTPNLDALMPQGWVFNHAYATGTRSVRGIEAVFTGFSPGPSRSVVKLNKSQSGFFSLASLLKRHDYHTQFIYGGESHFDNMKSFFLGNGVDDIRDLSTFDEPRFVGSWGASDQDLYAEAHKQFVKLDKASRPFFSLVFTTSNHTPWEYPDNCPAAYSGNRQSRENAIRYADCALGEFIRKAKASDYWKDTLFLIIADHDSRVQGSDMVPIDHFRIPALILGAGVAPKVDARLVSQIDFPTTLLSLAGISDAHPMLGFDLTRAVPRSKQRAPIQYGENYSWLSADHAVVLRPKLPARVYAHDGNKLLEQLDNQQYEGEINRTKANALWSNLAYSKGFYRNAR